MSALPSVHEKDNFTDWVVATARTTEVDAYLLWRLDEQQTEAELMEWVDDVIAYSEITKEELILAINRIDQNTVMPDISPAPIPVESVLNSAADNPAETDNDVGTTEPDGSKSADAEMVDLEEGPRFNDLITESDPQTAAPNMMDDPEVDGMQQPTHQDISEDDTIVTEREYKRFQEQVQEVVQNLINFLISYDMLSENTKTGHSEIEYEIEQAAEQADSPSEFFQRIESILTQLENKYDLDFTEVRQSTGQNSAENAEEPAQLVNELKSSIDELQQLRDQQKTTADMHGSTPDDSAVDTTESTQMTTGLSRNDDPRVLGSLNRLAETIQDRISESATTESSGSEKSLSQSSQKNESPSPPQQDGDADIEQDDTDDVSASSSGVTSGSAVGFAAGDSETSADPGYSSRAALFPIDLGWGLAALSYGGLDMFSTILVLGNGGEELNPIYNLLGQSIAGFVIWKTLVLFVLFILFYPDNPEKPSTTDWLIPIGTAVVGVLLTINNLSVLGGGGGLI
jgi:hypothetical protein